MAAVLSVRAFWVMCLMRERSRMVCLTPQSWAMLRAAFEFDGVALAVLEADCLDVFAAVGLDGLDEAGGGVLSAGEDNEGFFAVHGVFLAMG